MPRTPETSSTASADGSRASTAMDRRPASTSAQARHALLAGMFDHLATRPGGSKGDQLLAQALRNDR